jgi:hypothetical protein
VSARSAPAAATAAAPVRRGRAGALAGLVLAAATAGCGGGDEAAGPVDAALLGAYSLVALNDRPLPAVLYPGPTSSTHVVAGTLDLRGDRTFVLTEVLRAYRADGSPVAGTDAADTTRGTFSGGGAALTFRVDYGPGIGVLDVGTATVTGTRIAYTDRFSASPGPSPVYTIYTYEKR